jgi:dihydropteroate synthase
VLNVTSDSFSDGGRFFAVDLAVEHALRMAEEGAAIIDIGGESTRPGALPVPEEEELRRVLPVIERLAEDERFAISIDTMKPAVARAAVERGAEIINDVTGLREPGDARGGARQRRGRDRDAYAGPAARYASCPAIRRCVRRDPGIFSTNFHRVPTVRHR